MEIGGDRSDARDPLPREAQREALSALAAARSHGFKSSLVVMAPGLGKTFVAAWDAQQLSPEGPILYLAHRAEILDQAAKTFRRVFGRGIRLCKLHEDNGYDPSAALVFSTIQTMHNRFSNWPR